MQDFFSNLDVGAYIFNEYVPIETFNISFESTQNMLLFRGVLWF